MTDIFLTRDQIAAMSPVQRRALIERLERPVADLFPSMGAVERMRHLRLGLMACGSAGLIPWIAILSTSLPNTYTARNWSVTWVGFDALLLVSMATTAILGWQRRQLLILTAFATGVLLVCDAWFDIMTASPDDLRVSLATAVFGELPLAAILIVGALRLLRLIAAQLWILQPQMHLWQSDTHLRSWQRPRRRPRTTNSCSHRRTAPDTIMTPREAGRAKRGATKHACRPSSVTPGRPPPPTPGLPLTGGRICLRAEPTQVHPGIVGSRSGRPAVLHYSGVGHLGRYPGNRVRAARPRGPRAPRYRKTPGGRWR